MSLYKGKSGVVLFFFPKAFTGGCVCENAGFRDYISKYSDKGYTVLGASRDEPATLVKFKQIYRLNYTLLSDRTTIWPARWDSMAASATQS